MRVSQRKSASKSKSQTVWFPWWALFLLVSFAVGTIWLRLDIVRTSYEVSQVDSLIRNAKKENETLSLEIARFRSPLSLKRLARDKYGLDSPTSGQVIYLREPKELSDSKELASQPTSPTSKKTQDKKDHVNVTQAHPRSH